MTTQPARKGRKKGQSTIFTDTPEKQLLKDNEKKKPKAQTKKETKILDVSDDEHIQGHIADFFRETKRLLLGTMHISSIWSFQATRTKFKLVNS